MIDLLGSNYTGLNTRAYDASGVQIFHQETLFIRNGPIAEIGLTYAINTNGKTRSRTDQSFGKEEF